MNYFIRNALSSATVPQSRVF